MTEYKIVVKDDETYDVYERRNGEWYLRWKGLSKAGLRDLPDMI